MAYAVELNLELDIEAQIYDIWQTLKAARISSYMLDGSFRPHISLGVCEDIDRESYRASLESFANSVAPFKVWLPNIGMFMQEQAVVYIGVTKTRLLFDLHERFTRDFGNCAINPNSHYHVNQWVPHITLAMEIDTANVSRMMDVIVQPVKPLLNRYVEINQVGLVDTETGETFYHFDLNAAPNGD